jgi:predicted nucleic acid-binding protein
MIFDTDVLVWAFRGNKGAASTINTVTDRALSIVSFMELLQGARSKLEARRIQVLLRDFQFRVLPLSESIGATAAAIIEDYALAHGIRVTDALIAATAIASGETLCTGNTKHFRPIPALSRVVFRP